VVKIVVTITANYTEWTIVVLCRGQYLNRKDNVQG